MGHNFDSIDLEEDTRQQAPGNDFSCVSRLARRVAYMIIPWVATMPQDSRRTGAKHQATEILLWGTSQAARSVPVRIAIVPDLPSTPPSNRLWSK